MRGGGKEGECEEWGMVGNRPFFISLLLPNKRYVGGKWVGKINFAYSKMSEEGRK